MFSCIVLPLKQSAGSSKLLAKEFFSLTINIKVLQFFPFIFHEGKSEQTPCQGKEKVI